LPAAASALCTTRERVVIHPPKRPQIQRPAYFHEGEPTQPLVDESELRVPLSSDMSPSNEGQDINGPTHPLQADQPLLHRHLINDQREIHTQQRAQKVAVRRTFWNQLQGWFKSPYH
jgi:hypothetical protein